MLGVAGMSACAVGAKQLVDGASRGYCQIPEARMGITFSFEFGFNKTDSSFVVQFYRFHPDNKAVVSLFRCTTKQATVKLVTTAGGASALEYASPELSCFMACVPSPEGGNRACSPLIGDFAPQVGKDGFTMTCNTAGRQCELREKWLGLLWSGDVTATECSFGNCVAAVAGGFGGPEPVPMAAVAPMSGHQKASLVMGLLCLAVAAAMLMLSAGFFIMSRGYHTYKALPVATAASGSSYLGEEMKTYDLMWSDVTYNIKKKEVLTGVSGVALAGELLAIMGYVTQAFCWPCEMILKIAVVSNRPSGGGKSSLLDVLALKRKRGESRVPISPAMAS
jgi:hypothetical protein